MPGSRGWPVPTTGVKHVELVERARAGDHEAFTALVDGVVDRLFNVARLILRDRDAADDATQETLVRAWRDLPGLRDPASFDGWIYRLTVHACHDQIRARRRLERHVADIGRQRSSADHIADVADRDLLSRAFGRLSLDHREVLVLFHYGGLTLAETAQALEAPVGTVKSRLHYAMHALRGLLEADARIAPPTGDQPSERPR